MQFEWGTMMQIIIKDYDNTEEGQLKRLLDLAFEDDGLLNIIKDSKYKFAYSAVAGNNVLAVIFGWESNFHPYCIYFRILSHPFYEMYRLEEKLLSYVKKVEDFDKPLQTSIWESAIHCKKIYERNGFKEIRRTFMPTLQLADVKEGFQINEKNDRIKTLEEISSNSELMQKLTLLVKRNYEETHRVNPVVDAQVDEWQRLILANDTVMKGSYIILDPVEDEVMAYSFLHESDNTNVYELGWCGCSEKQYKRLIPQLISKHIKHSIRQGISAIVGEFDTTDYCAMEVLKTFPFEPYPTWITYQKN